MEQKSTLTYNLDGSVAKNVLTAQGSEPRAIVDGGVGWQDARRHDEGRPSGRSTQPGRSLDDGA